jgi:aldose 1-epimerase
MLPWPNRIREGRFTFEGETYQLRTTKDDGTARHGDVRKRLWKVVSEDERHATYRFQSIDHTDFNFPFALDAELTYALEDADFCLAAFVDKP